MIPISNNKPSLAFHQFRKLFFFKYSKKSSAKTNLLVKTKFIKIKLALSKITSYQHNFQRQFNFLDSFYAGNSYENTSNILFENPLMQNPGLLNPENIWNTLLGMRQDKLSRFYLINRYPSLRRPSKWYATRKSKFRRTPYQSYHINDLILRTWINRQYSIGNFYNREIRFSFYYGEEYLDYTKDMTWYGRGFGTYVSSIKDAFLIRFYQLFALLVKNRTYWKTFMLFLLNAEMTHQAFLPALAESGYSFLEYSDKSNLILLPKDFELETPFTYKGRKFGRQETNSFLKEITYTKAYSFRFPLNTRTKSGLNSTIKEESMFKKNFFQVSSSYGLAPYNYIDWWKSISLRKSEVGFNRNFSLSHSNQISPILPKKDRFFESMFASKTFFSMSSPSLSLEKSSKVEDTLLGFSRPRFSRKLSVIKRK